MDKEAGQAYRQAKDIKKAEEERKRALAAEMRRKSSETKQKK